METVESNEGAIDMQAPYVAWEKARQEDMSWPLWEGALDPTLPSWGYSAHLARGRLKVKAASPAFLLHAAFRLSSAFRLGTVRERLGDKKPATSWRILSLQGAIAQEVALGSLARWEETLRYVVQVGGNALLVDGPIAQEEIFHLASDFGIEIIVRLREGMELTGNKVWWSASTIYGEASSSDLLSYERARAQIQELVRRLPHGHRLIYRIEAPTLLQAQQEAVWLYELSLDIPSTVTVAFSAKVEGTMHPLWGALRHWHEPLGVPLLPMVEAEASIAVFDDVLSRQSYPPFEGMAIDTEKLPLSLPASAAFEALWSGGLASFWEAHG